MEAELVASGFFEAVSSFLSSAGFTLFCLFSATELSFLSSTALLSSKVFLSSAIALSFATFLSSVIALSSATFLSSTKALLSF